MSEMTKEVRSFYDEHPCGTEFIVPQEYDQAYFSKYDSYRYTHVPSILEIIDGINWRGKRVLEIGTGLGADAQKIIERGGLYNGLDLTPASVAILKRRFQILGLPYEDVREGNAEEMDYPDESFDIVYSCGVLLTSPRIDLIVRHIYRIVKKDGVAIIMLYHKNSLNYYLSISLIRRMGIFLLYLPGVDKVVSKLTGEDIERINKHKRNLKEMGLSYLRMKNFIHRSTDGPDHPYSSVWTVSDCERLFSGFTSLEYKVRFLNKRHFPFVFDLLPQAFERHCEHHWGWNLWITASK